jgi:hypothetical protein
MRWMGHVAHVGKDYRRPGCRWEDTNKTDLKYIGCEDAEWIYVAQLKVQWQALEKTVINLWVL